MTIRLVHDFEADLRAIYAEKLAAVGTPSRADEDADDLIVRYFSLIHRLIRPARRAVLWSNELRAREPELSTDQRAALAAIERASTKGSDLNLFQSRDIAKSPSKTDPQLLEWGITHFHLGLSPDPKHPAMVVSTSALLFVVVREDALFFVDVRDHSSFSDQQVFDIAVANWPELVEHARFHGALGLERDVTSAERQTLRKANINVLTATPDGRVYGPVMGGRTTSGAPIGVVMTHLLPRTGATRAWEQYCKKSPEKVLAAIPEERRAGLSTIELHVSEMADGELAFSATNLTGGPLVLGVGRPPQ